VALFLNRGGSSSQQRASNLGELVDVATGGRRGIAGRPVGWSGALSIPAVWSAVRLRANVVASLPVGVFRDGPDGLPRRLPASAVPGVLSQPSAQFDMTSWLHASQVSLDMRGNSWGRVVARDPRTFLPTQVELVHPDDVGVRVLRSGEVETRFGGRVVDPVDVWHEMQNEVPGDVVGMSPISAAARALGIPLAAQDYGAGFYTEALTPSALLSSDGPIDEDGARIVKTRVRATQSGREPLVLGGNWRYQQLSVSPADAMYLEVMRAGDTDVARLFDVPGEMIDANTSGSSITYANREQRVQDLLAFRLGPAIARRERALSRLTVRGQYVKLNIAGLLRGDLMTRYKSYQIGLTHGFLTIDEVRALEERGPMPPEELALLNGLGLLGKPGATDPAAAAPADGATPATTGVTTP
jgi:HK97 family phage portal protein